MSALVETGTTQSMAMVFRTHVEQQLAPAGAMVIADNLRDLVSPSCK